MIVLGSSWLQSSLPAPRTRMKNVSIVSIVDTSFSKYGSVSSKTIGFRFIYISYSSKLDILRGPYDIMYVWLASINHKTQN